MSAQYSGIDILLHDHLDGAFPLNSSLVPLYVLNRLPIPIGTNLVNKVLNNFRDPHADILQAFSHVISLMQSWETIFYAAKNHVIIRARQGIKYDEFMLAPQYHLQGEFKEEAKIDPVRAMARVIEAVVAGIKAAEEEYPKIEANFLVAIGRELDPNQAMKVLQAVETSDRDYVVGFNLVCDESQHPPEKHIATYEYAAAAEINADCHVAEWVRRPNQKPDFERDLPALLRNLRTAFLRLKNLKRAGHCTALGYDPEMMKFAIDHNIGITYCPGSNLQGGNIPNIKALRLRYVLGAGVLASINPDDDFFQPNIHQVSQMCDDEYRFNKEERNKLRLNAWNTRFGHRKQHEINP